MSAAGAEATHRIGVAVADLEDRPGGARLRQLLYGEPVVALDASGTHLHVRAARDGYEGWLRADLAAPPQQATHRVVALATHLYAAPDLKSRDVMSLSFGARLTVDAAEDRFLRTDAGHFVPAVHLAPLRGTFGDPAGVAELFLGTPYLWGGNSRLGIDCSGLVQAAFLACGIACPGDSGPQEAALGTALPADATPARGDLVFWKGHVAIMVGAADMIHANAHHMSVVYEPLAEAEARIAAQGDGPITSLRRVTLG